MSNFTWPSDQLIPDYDLAGRGTGLPYQFYLTQNGDGTGVYNQNSDFSAAPVDIKYTAVRRYDIHSILVVVSAAAKIYQPDYGSISGGLTNGVKFFIQMNGFPLIPLLSGVAVKKNYEWLTLAPDMNITAFAGTADTLSVDFNMLKQYGMPLRLNPGDSFIVQLNDNFSTLPAHFFGVRGIQFF